MFLTLCTIATTSWSQEDFSETHYSNELRIGFFQFFMNTFFMEYEHCFRNSTSLVLQGGMTLKKDSYEEIYGGQGGIQFRVYAATFKSDKSVVKLESAYFGPFFKYRYLDVTDLDGADINSAWRDGPINNLYNTYTGGMLLGVKISALQRVTFDINMGGGIQFTNEANDNVPDYALNMFGIAYTGVTPTANFTLGFRF